MKALRSLQSTLAVVLLLTATSAFPDIRNPQASDGILIAPQQQGTVELVSLPGKGKFVSARITKQGLTNALVVILTIDERDVVKVNMDSLLNLGLTETNPYGVVLLNGKDGVVDDIKTMTIGFPTPLVYKRNLTLSVNVLDVNLLQVTARVIHGK